MRPTRSALAPMSACYPLSPFSLQERLQTQANSCGLPVKLIFSLLLSYPLAGLLKRVPDTRPEYKNLFSLRCVAVARTGRRNTS